VLFADLVEFTSLVEGLDPEAVRDLQSRYFDLAREVVARYGGTIEKFIGDAVMAVWGAPLAHEDDAERAVRAGLDFVMAVGVMRGPTGAPLEARAAVMSGEAAVTIGAQGQGLVSGDLVNATSRLQASAPSGRVLVAEATMRAATGLRFEPAGPVRLRGRSKAVTAFLAHASEPRERQDATLGTAARFIGRQSELSALREALASMIEDRTGRLVTVLGVAGVGKSRLIAEMRESEAQPGAVVWHVGRAPAYGDGITFAPVADMVRGAVGAAPGEQPEIAGRRLTMTLVGLARDEAERRWIEPRVSMLLSPDRTTAYERDELFAAWRRFFELMAEQAPTVLIFEDLQWGDRSLLDFIEYLGAWSREHPLLLVAVARPELLEREPEWSSTVPTALTLRLEPLTSDEVSRLLGELAPGLPDEADRLIAERAGGIPLYAVEVVRMLLDRGQLAATGGALVPGAHLRQIDLPDSLRGLIAARIDGLPPGERDVLLSLSVLGGAFSVDTVRAITGVGALDLQTRVDSLIGRGLLLVDHAGPSTGSHLRFGQELVREVAYRTLSRSQRRMLHLATADHFETLADEELVESIAGHLQAAYRADPDAPDMSMVAERGRQALRRAARRAMTLHASGRALQHLEDALELAANPAERADLLEEAATAARAAARFELAERFLEEWIEFSQAAGLPAEEARGTARLASLLLTVDRHERALNQLEDALRAVADLGEEPAVVELGGQLARARLLVGEEHEAVLWAERTMVAADGLGLVPVATDALITRGTARHRIGEAAAGLEDLERAVEIAVEHDLLGTELRARNNLAWLVVTDDPHLTMETARRGMELATAMGVGDMALQLADVTARAAIDTGDWRPTVDMLQALDQQADLALAHRAGFAATGAILHALLGDARPESAIEALPPLDPKTDEQLVAGLDYARAWVAFVGGHFGDARRRARHAAAHEISAEPEHHFARALAARASLWASNRRKLERDLAALNRLPVQGRMVAATRMTLEAGLAAMTGPRAAAEAHYVEAESRWRALDLPFHLALCRLEKHRLLGDSEALVEAVDILRSLGGVGLLKQVASSV
jgi:class 3 adenylate cyclase/tetratricopeptide (TPR) repeat protein